LDSYLTVNDSRLELNSIPQLSQDQKGVLTVNIENPLLTEEILTPEIYIYNRLFGKELIKKFELDSFTLTSKETKDFEWVISYLDKPGVYDVIIKFVNQDNIQKTPLVNFKYAVGGSFATIKYVSLNKNYLTKNEDYILSISYSGTPMNIIETEPNNLNLAVLVLNENKKKISTYKSMLDFNKGTYLKLPLTASKDAQQIFLDITITDDFGNIIDHYSNEMTGNFFPEENSNKSNLVVGIFVALLLIFISIILFFFKKNRKLGTGISILFFILFISLFMFNNKVEASTVQWIDSQYGSDGYNQINYIEDFTISNFNYLYSNGSDFLVVPGAFEVNGILKYFNIYNQSYKNNSIIFQSASELSTTSPETDREAFDAIPLSPGIDIGVGSAIKISTWVEGERSLVYCPNSAGDCYAFKTPQTPGEYYLKVKISSFISLYSYYTPTFAGSKTGYIKFNFVHPNPDEISVTTGSCDRSKIVINWNDIMTDFGCTPPTQTAGGTCGYYSIRKVDNLNQELGIAFPDDTSLQLSYASTTDIFTVLTDLGHLINYNFWDSASGTPSTSCTPAVFPVCGSATTIPVSSPPTENLCTSGSPSNPFKSSEIWKWYCWGQNGSDVTVSPLNKECTAPVLTEEKNGQCNSSYNSSSLSFIPLVTDDLCTLGEIGNDGVTVDSFKDPVELRWRCFGTVTTASCLAYLDINDNSTLMCNIITDDSVNLNEKLTIIASSTSNNDAIWMFEGENEENVNLELTSNTISKIFTTTGLKKISARIASSTPNIFGSICSTTVNVIRTDTNTEEF
jgi:hypothetical protein